TIEVDAGDDQVIPEGEDGALIVTSSNDIATWLWSPVDFLSCLDCPDPFVLKPDHDITYIIIVTDENGCQASDTVSITILDEDEVKIYAPNIFSPNGDAINET